MKRLDCTSASVHRTPQVNSGGRTMSENLHIFTCEIQSGRRFDSDHVCELCSCTAPYFVRLLHHSADAR